MTTIDNSKVEIEPLKEQLGETLHEWCTTHRDGMGRAMIYAFWTGIISQNKSYEDFFKRAMCKSDFQSLYTKKTNY